MPSVTRTPASERHVTFEKRVVFTATEMNVRRGLSCLIDLLSDLGLSFEEKARIELVLAETLNNIVEHAYRNIDDGQIEIRVYHDTRGLLFRVSDRGAAMPDRKPPLGLQTPMNVAPPNLPESGFGWFLIRKLAHDIYYRRHGRTNICSFRMTVDMDRQD